MSASPKLCRICKKPGLPHHLYCPRCDRLIGVGIEQLAIVTALKSAYDPESDGFVCQYTGILLEQDDIVSPWYITYDHVIPKKKGDIVVCAAFLNVMKSDLSEDEFWAVVMEYDRHRKGAPFNRDIVKFLYWNRRPRPVRPPVQSRRTLREVLVSECVICGHKPRPYSYYCARCLKFVRYHRERAEAMKTAWNREQDGFIDYYTGLKLDTEDHNDPYYLSFDHRTPGKKGTLVVTSFVFNVIKTSLSEDEFYLVMNELARHHEGKPFNRDVVKFEYWKGA